MKMDLTFPEGAVVARAWDVARGFNPYHDWREWPHAFAPYGPLTYYPVGWIARLTDSVDHPKEIFTIGRLQSLACLCGALILIGGIAFKAGLPPAWGMIGAAVFLIWEHVLSFAASYRPDAPQVFLSLLVVWIILGGRGTLSRIIVALLFLSISMWIKPTSWGIAFACFLWIWRATNRRVFWTAISLFVLLNLGLAVALNWRWSGRLFLNMIGSLDNGWKPSNVLYFYQGELLIPLMILIGGVAFSLHAVIRLAQSEAGLMLYASVLASFAAATLQNLKVGADVNYYLECYALASIAVAQLAFSLWEKAKISDRAGVIFLLLFFPLAVYDGVTGLVSIRSDLVAIKRSWASPLIANPIRKIQGAILVGNHPFLALERPSPSTILDFVQYSILVERGRIEDRELIRRLETRNFEAIVMDSEDFNRKKAAWLFPRFKKALFENYRESERVANLSILKPKSGEREQEQERRP